MKRTGNNSQEEARNLEQEQRNWLDLPADITLVIFSKIGVSEILLDVQKVCSSWWKLCKEPKLFQSIVIPGSILNCSFGANLERYIDFIKAAVDRSCGQLTEFSTEGGFCSDEILLYVVNSSSLIKYLRVASACSNVTANGLIEAVRNAPLLEELEVPNLIVYTDEHEVIEDVQNAPLLEGSEVPSSELSMDEFVKEAGQLCSQLKCFHIKTPSSTHIPLDLVSAGALEIAIAENMSQLRELRISGCHVNETGLQALLDRCVHLKYLEFVNCLLLSLGQDFANLKEICDYRGIKLCGQDLGWFTLKGFGRHMEGEDDLLCR